MEIRIAGPEHADILLKWYSDKDNMKYMNSCFRRYNYSKEDLIEDLQFNPEERHYIVYEDNKPIGMAGIEDIDWYDRRGEIYYFIGEKQYKGKGLGKKMVIKLIHYCFDILGLRIISANVISENKASIKILNQQGFETAGIFKESNKSDDGRYYDDILFFLNRKNYKTENYIKDI